MRKLLLSVVALFAMSAQNAFAINLTFQFDVNSSGPSIYACNAGIRHGLNSDRICFDRTDVKKSCTPGCAAGDLSQCVGRVKPVNCTCTGEANGAQGTYRMDFLSATTAEWTESGVQAYNDTTHNLAADAKNGGNAFNQIFGSSQPNGWTNTEYVTNDAYKNQIKSLTINLGSEVYGAEYFVDICYRGPQIDYKYDGKIPSTLNFALLAKATIFDLKKVDGESYKKLAGLQVRAEARCIMDDEFNYCLADLLPGETAGCGTNAGSHDYYTDGESKGQYQDLDETIDVATLIHKAAMTHWDGSKTPRFCQIRYSFNEKNRTQRKWKLSQARICTYTEISEPSKK